MGKGNDGISFPHLCQRPNGLGGQETSPSTPIYSGEAHGSLTQAKAQPLPSPTPLLLRICLAKPCRSTAAPTTPCRRAAVGAIFLNLSFPLAGSRRRRRLPSRTCVECGGAVRAVLGSPVIWITSCSTTSSPFFERFRSRSTKVCRCIRSLIAI